MPWRTALNFIFQEVFIMYKKILAGLLAFALVFGSAAALPATELKNGGVISVSAEDSEVLTYGDYIYNVRDDGTITIIMYTGSDINITIPDKIDGKQVTRIGNNSFSDNRTLISVTIPEGVKEIGWEAFYQTNIKFFTIGSTVNKIEGKAFYKTPWIDLMGDDNSQCVVVNNILVDAYSNVKNNTVIVPDGVKVIGEYAFNPTVEKTGNGSSSIRANSYLSSVTLPQSVETIENHAFELCDELTSVKLPNSLRTIGVGAFWDCESLSEIALPANLESIKSGAFYSCESLKKIQIPNSVTELGSQAFKDCISLETINIPTNIKTIEHFTFSGTNIKSIDIPSNITEINMGAFESCENLTLVTIPGSVTFIGLGAFRDCTNLKSVIFEDGLPDEWGDTTNLTIDNYAFENCSSLANVLLSDNVGKINTDAFFNCTKLKSITIPKTVWSIYEAKTSTSYLYGAIGYYGKSYEHIKMDGFTIYCYANSAGERYAKDLGFAYELLDKPAVNGTGKVSIENSTSGLKVENISVNIAKSGSGKTDKTVKIGSDGKFTVEGLTDGKYDFTFNADKCVPRTYSVSVSGGTFKLDSVELHLYGDVNGDGKITTADVGKANADTRNSKKLTDSYDKKVADVNEDGKITTADVGKTNAHVRGTKNLW